MLLQKPWCLNKKPIKIDDFNEAEEKQVNEHVEKNKLKRREVPEQNKLKKKEKTRER